MSREREQESSTGHWQHYSARQFIHADHLGSTRLITDGAGAVQNRLDFSAWGEILRADGPDLPRYGWCGAYGYQDERLPPRSSDTGPGSDLAFGLLHIGARYYDPAAGGWIMRDPIGMAGGFNTYVMASNMPTGFVDPSGLFSVGNVNTTGGIQAGLFRMYAKPVGGVAYGVARAFGFDPAGTFLGWIPGLNTSYVNGLIDTGVAAYTQPWRLLGPLRSGCTTVINGIRKIGGRGSAGGAGSTFWPGPWVY